MVRRVKSRANDTPHFGAANYPRIHDSRKRNAPMSWSRGKKCTEVVKRGPGLQRQQDRDLGSETIAAG